MKYQNGTANRETTEVLAKELGINGYSKMLKAELIEAITQAQRPRLIFYDAPQRPIPTSRKNIPNQPQRPTPSHEPIPEINVQRPEDKTKNIVSDFIDSGNRLVNTIPKTKNKTFNWIKNEADKVLDQVRSPSPGASISLINPRRQPLPVSFYF